jgi:hypothetical protein
MLKHVNRESLEQRRKTGSGLSPRHADLANTVVIATKARHPRMRKCLELAAVEVSPNAFLVVIVQPAFLAALGTWPRLPFVMLGVDVDALVLHVQLHANDGPWRRKTDQLLI